MPWSMTWICSWTIYRINRSEGDGGKGVGGKGAGGKEESEPIDTFEIIQDVSQIQGLGLIHLYFIFDSAYE